MNISISTISKGKYKKQVVIRWETRKVKGKQKYGSITRHVPKDISDNELLKVEKFI
jgi:hypothetical protein